MKVLSFIAEPWKVSFSPISGVQFDLRGGDVCDPYWFNGGKWLDASTPAPTFTIRFFCPWRILPWLSLRIGKWNFAAGWKAYEVNNAAYLRFTKPEDNFPGSCALCFTIQSKWDFQG